MEGIVVEENRRYHQHAGMRWPQEPRSHLSPPETSRSRNDAIDKGNPMVAVPPGRSMFALPAPGSRSDLNMLLNQSHDTKPESPAEERRPHSWRMPMERPSLPSLKTVLGDSMTSPPKTPSPQTALSRPSPSHTNFDLTFGDSYPNKKQRTESFDSFRRPYAAEAGRSSSTGFSTPLEPPRDQNPTRHDHASQYFNPLSERKDDYRRSLPPLLTPGSATSWTPMQTFPTSQNANPSERHSSVNDPGAYRRRSDAAPTAAAQPRAASNYASESRERGSFGQTFREMATSERPVSQHRTAISSSNYSSSSSREGEPPGFRSSGETWYPNTAEEGVPHLRDDHRLDHSDRSPEQPPEGYLSSPFEASPAPLPVMLSSFYDLRHPKSRKRSNLPKQSTEIMKRWFEEVGCTEVKVSSTPGS